MAVNMNKTSPLMTRRIMWFAMFQGVVFFCGVLIYLSIKSPKEPTAQFDVIKYVVMLISLTTLLSLGKIKAFISKNSAGAKPDSAKAQASFFIVMAICEASILIGVILAWLSGNLNDIYMMAAPGLIGMALNFPRED